MDQPRQTRWQDLDPAQQAQLERELRARGIDPSTVRSVHFEPAEPHARPADDGLIDLTAPASPDPSRAGSAPSPITVSGPLHITISGVDHVYPSLDAAPPHVRQLLAGIQGIDDAGAGTRPGTPRSGSFTTTTTTTTTMDPEQTALLESLIRQGRTIDAIKLVRDQTGMGLAESKDLVDRLTPIIAPGGASGGSGRGASRGPGLILLALIAGAILSFITVTLLLALGII